MTKNRAAVAAIIVAVAIAGPVGFVTPAYAHNALVASTPTSGETLTELPPQFSITTNEALLALPGSNGFALQILDATGAYYGDGCVAIVDATMSADAELGEPGAYRMLWQAVSADGHSVAGEIPFTWAGDTEPSASSATPPVCGEAATATPSASASPAPATSEPTAAPAPASGIDLPTVLWIGGVLLAIGIAVAVASRRNSP